MFTAVDSNDGKYLAATLPTGIGGGGSGTGLTMECFVLANPVSGALQAILRMASTQNRIMYIGFDALGKLYTSVLNDKGVQTLFLIFPSAVANGTTRHVAFTQSLSGTTVTTKLYVDGVEVASGTTTDAALRYFTSLYVGGSNRLELLRAGTIGHVAVYNTALSATRLLAHYQAANTLFAGETSDAKVRPLLRFAGWLRRTSLPTLARRWPVRTSSPLGRKLRCRTWRGPRVGCYSSTAPGGMCCTPEGAATDRARRSSWTPGRSRGTCR